MAGNDGTAIAQDAFAAAAVLAPAAVGEAAGDGTFAAALGVPVSSAKSAICGAAACASSPCDLIAGGAEAGTEALGLAARDASAAGVARLDDGARGVEVVGAACSVHASASAAACGSAAAYGSSAGPPFG